MNDPVALRQLTHESDLRDTLYLVKNGVPFDVAFCLSPYDRKAWVITIGELSGMTWDYFAEVWK